jgi:hypothetical protein
MILQKEIKSLKLQGHIISWMLWPLVGGLSILSEHYTITVLIGVISLVFLFYEDFKDGAEDHPFRRPMPDETFHLLVNLILFGYYLGKCASSFMNLYETI